MHRVERLPGGVARLVDSVPDGDIPQCLALLTASVIDVADVHSPEIAEALTQWRERGTASERSRAHVRSVVAQHDLDAFVHQRRGDIDKQRESFRRARAFECIMITIDSEGQEPRTVLRESVYEAAAAMGGTGGVVGILAVFVV